MEHTKRKIRYSTFGSTWCMLEVGAKVVQRFSGRALVVSIGI